MTPDLTPGRRHQVEEWLERPLTDDELVTVPRLDVLSLAQLAVVDTVANRNRLACLLYLRGIVEDVTMTEATAFMQRLERPRGGPAWHASGERRAQVEACLYRALTEAELAPVGSLGELTIAHLAVVRRLARYQRLAGFMYLEGVV